MNEKITLSGVPETMLQTLYARAKETCTRGAIRDEKATALVERIDYDFSLADKDAAMHSGVIARTIVLDRLVEGFLAQHQSAAVVNLACGLDTRCYRVEGYGRWYNLDLPERQWPCAQSFCPRVGRSRSWPCPRWTTGARLWRSGTRPRSSSSRG